MELSIFIAQIIAVLYLSVAIGILFSGDYYKKMLPAIMDDAPAMYIGGLFALIIGFLMVRYHNIWVKDWTVLITIFGWLALVKGVLLIAFPKSLGFFKPMFKNLNKFVFIPIIIGLIFGYFGFIA